MQVRDKMANKKFNRIEIFLLPRAGYWLLDIGSWLVFCLLEIRFWFTYVMGLPDQLTSSKGSAGRFKEFNLRS